MTTHDRSASTHTFAGHWRGWPPLAAWTRWLAVGLLTLALGACGGGNSDPGADAGDPAAVPAPAGAGDFKAAVWLNTLEPLDIANALQASGKNLQGVSPMHTVSNYRLEYMTTDADGQLVRASGLVSVPLKTPGALSPVLGYQHATIFSDAEAPSNRAIPGELAVALASMGFLVVAPDYVGYGVSKGTPHPYLLAAPSAAAVVDMHTAAQAWQKGAGIADNGQLFLVGYSEGAYATLAAHRAMAATNSVHLRRLQSSITGAGPYNVQTTLDGVLRTVRDEEPLLGALLNPGLLRYLGSSVRNDVRRAILRQLVPESSDIVLDARFLDPYLSDDEYLVNRQSNVHNWLPAQPVSLYHGKDDRTVTYGSSLSTLQAMQAQGAGTMVSLTECTAIPSDHGACLLPFVTFMVNRIHGAPAPTSPRPM